ncbi:MAG: hypothetical protein AB2693_17190 [Candidatus Thiodiazotropha sp.]
MSVSRLQKNIDSVSDQSSLKTGDKPVSTPLILSDSKGKYLKRVVNRNSNIERSIVWQCKGGATSSERLDWLRSHSTDLIEKYRSVTLYVWVGTCDFTVKDSTHHGKGKHSRKSRKFISIRDPDTAFKKFKHNLNSLKKHCARKHIQVTFLHVPYYSIEAYNAQKGHENPVVFKNDDKILTDLIKRANSFINDLNCEVNSYSPKFNEDLVRSRKKRGSSQRYSINLKLLHDGLHPCETLARSWLASLTRKITKDCT